MEKGFLSVVEVAQKLGLSRMQVTRKIKKGEIPAIRVGRTYAIPEEGLPGIYQKITPAEKKKVEETVKQILKEYGEAIRRLGYVDS